MRSKNKIQVLGWLTLAFGTAAGAAEHPAAVPATQSRQVVFRDPVTGELRAPTEAEMAQLRRAAEAQQAIQARSSREPAKAAGDVHWREVDLGNGVKGKIADVPERPRSRLVAERGPDGKYRVQHASGAAAKPQEATP